MAILKPTGISPNSISLDATKDIVVSWVNSGDRQTAYQIQFYDNADNTLIHDTGKLLSYSPIHNLLANTLTNGITYKYQITVYNQLDQSISSDWIILKCSSTPTCNITNLSATILNSSYLFQGTFSQAESVAIKSFRFILYDSFDSIVSLSDEIFSSTIEYEFLGLKNDTDYQIELQVKSQDNLLGTTGKLSFHVQYDVPNTALNLESENITDKAAVRLSWRVIQIIGEIIEGTISYENGEKVNLENGAIAFSDLNMNNFHMKLWLEWNELTDGVEIIRFKSDIGDVWIEWEQNRFHIWKYIYGLSYHVISEEVLPDLGSTIFIGMDFINNLIGIHSEVL